MTATLTLLRHPRAQVGAGTCYGRLDVPADPLHEDAVFEQTVAELPAQAVATSPSRRCRQLAERLVAHWRLGCTVDARLMELDFGRWEGCEWDAPAGSPNAIARDEVDAWAADPLQVAPGGGESLAQLHDRLLPWLDAAVRAGQPLLAVTHGGPMRVLAVLWRGGRLEDAVQAPAPPCGSRVAWSLRPPGAAVAAPAHNDVRSDQSSGNSTTSSIRRR